MTAIIIAAGIAAVSFYIGRGHGRIQGMLAALIYTKALTTVDGADLGTVQKAMDYWLKQAGVDPRSVLAQPSVRR